MWHARVQVVLVGLSRSSATRQREFAAELVRELQELASALSAPGGGASRPSSAAGEGGYPLSLILTRT